MSLIFARDLDLVSTIPFGYDPSTNKKKKKQLIFVFFLFFSLYLSLQIKATLWIETNVTLLPLSK